MCPPADTFISLVKKKYKFQREIVNKQLDTGPSLSDTQIKGVNGVLTDESQKISELVHQLRSLMSVSQ
ncbi:hypothetical protein EB796_012768 [Bugula neritina]|uniref:Uncharacterized protein n=1 Tax=Bugula neritina TaxID=10212 RepID=A0A7J7JTC2_BUGNE|nr:hypothetical protein EB796_012768 [Bugula neritina]